MSLTSQEKHFVEELRDWATIESELYSRRNRLETRYTQNQFGDTITDEKLKDEPGMQYLTQDKIKNTIETLEKMQSTLGDMSSGLIVNLLKMLG